MSKQTVKRQQFSMDFKLQLLKEYYESGSSMYKISKKHGVDDVTFYRWVRSFESKGLSLPSELSELENQVYMARKKYIILYTNCSRYEGHRVTFCVQRLLNGRRSYIKWQNKSTQLAVQQSLNAKSSFLNPRV